MLEDYTDIHPPLPVASQVLFLTAERMFRSVLKFLWSWNDSHCLFTEFKYYLHTENTVDSQKSSK